MLGQYMRKCSSKRQFQESSARHRIESIRRSLLKPQRHIQRYSLLHRRQRVQKQAGVSKMPRLGNDAFGQVSRYPTSARSRDDIEAFHFANTIGELTHSNTAEISAPFLSEEKRSIE